MEKDRISTGVAAEEVLQIAPRIYREYASEFSELARTTTSEPQRDIYLKTAQMWHDAATLFEFETGRFGQQKPAA